MPMTSFPADYSQLPTVSFVIPNLINDMHDGTIAQGDTWLHDNLDPYIQWAKTHNSLFILTFDEDDHTLNNQIATVITGQRVQPGAYTDRINHYSLLRTLQDAYGLPPIGASATAAPIQNIWNDGSGNRIRRRRSPSRSSGTTVTVDGSTSADPDGTVAGYRWDWGDGTAAGSGATASHPYAASGTYHVTLTVTDNEGKTGSITKDVTVTGLATLASDAFGRTATSGWGTADKGGAWTVTGSATRYAVNGSVGTGVLAAASTNLQAQLATFSATDVNEVADFSLNAAATGGGTTVGLLARRAGTSDYRAKIKFAAGGAVVLSVSRVVSNTETVLGSVTISGLTYVVGSSLRLRLVVTGGTGGTATLAATVWKVGATEPASPQLSRTDTTASLQAAGTIGAIFTSSSTSTGSTTASFDNLVVADPGSAAVNLPPTAAFTSSVSGRVASFDASGSTDSDGTIATYSWDFGDGSAVDTTSGAKPTHTYADVTGTTP